MKPNLTHTYTKEEIFSQLRAMGVPQNSVVLMHSSMRLVGSVEGGIQGLLDAMVEYCTADGGLFCIPTHTWDRLKAEIVLDLSDPKTCLGAFSDLAAADARGIRTENPTHSMMVFGDRARAEEFAKGEIEVCSGTAPESCYGKLCEMGGTVLLVGVAHNKNTYLHCVEEMLGMPDRLSEQLYEMKIRRTTGEIVPCQGHRHSSSLTKDISQRFPKYETAFRYYGAIADGFVGNAPTQACDARLMKEVMSLILSRCDGVDPLADERAFPPKWYC